MHLAGRDGLLQRFLVHMRDHQHAARAGFLGDRGDEAVAVEARRKGAAFLEFIMGQGAGIGEIFAHR